MPYAKRKKMNKMKMSFLLFVITSVAASSALKVGVHHMRNPLVNRGLATSKEQRKLKGLSGMMPAGVRSFKTQEANALHQFRSKKTDIEKYMCLQGIQNIDERLYYSLLVKHTSETMPIVYTPTVGAACQQWSEVYNTVPRGVYLSLEDKGNIANILEALPQKADIKAIVFTDGERILGLGDLGVNGMGIPVGKLALYTACAGIAPKACLPVHIDAGTNNQKLLDDPNYVGLRMKRNTPGNMGEYDSLIDEFISAAKQVFHERVLLQFEDFGNSNAFRLLEKYQTSCCTFNDDIQGTASVVLAGLFASSRISGRKLKDETFLFQGAGEAGVGIAELLSSAICLESGMSMEEARKQIHLVDSQGLITSHREHLAKHKQPFAHELHKYVGTLEDAVDVIKPTVLIGVSATPNAFNKQVLNKLAGHTPLAPVIFSLSNPTSKSECTAAQAYEWTHGACVFASGSPFDPLELHDGTRRVPGQGNNAYIFPALALAAISVQAKHLTDGDMYVAAKALACLVSKERLALGCVYPSLDDIRKVSLTVAVAVAENMFERGDAGLSPKPADLRAYIQSTMYHPSDVAEN